MLHVVLSSIMDSQGRGKAAKRLRRDVKESISSQGSRRILVPRRTSTMSIEEKRQLLSAGQSKSAELKPLGIDALQRNLNGVVPRLTSRSDGRQQFERRPLAESEFRLFVLDPGGFTDRLTGHLTEHNLAAPSLYYGLSYVWGQEHAIHSVFVDGGEIFIRPNLFQALRRIRNNSSQLYLWIDDVCINQEDEVEKNSQVGHMADIYRKAIGVFIWLGEGNATSTLAKECILALIRLDYNWTETWWKGHDIFALVELLNRPWFSRGWVIQEAAFSRTATIYCGDWQLPLDYLERAMDQIVLRLNVVNRTLLSIADNQILVSVHDSSAVKLIGIIRRVFEKSEDGVTILRRCLSLESLVEETRFTETTDCRDSIYAVMSLANDVNSVRQHSIVADYSKSDLDVYVDFIEHCVHQSSSLDIICRPWAPSLQLDRAVAPLPSWIVTKDRLPSGNLSSRHRLRLHGEPLVGNSQRRIYNCSLDRKPDIWFGRQIDIEKSHRFLIAKGIFLGQITGVSTRMADSIVYRDALEILGTIERSPATLWSISDTIWQTLCADRDRNGDRAPFSYRSAMIDVLRFISETSVDTDSGDDHQVMPCIDVEDLLATAELFHAHDFLKTVRDTVWNRRAFRSKPNPAEKRASKSMVGLVPRAARTGDIVCILYGCSVPVVLRKPQSSTSDETWILVGDAYVHGVMYGEEIKHALWLDSLKQTEREIKIK